MIKTVFFVVSLFYSTISYCEPCIVVDSKESNNILFQEKLINFNYEYCEYIRHDLMSFDGKQSIVIHFNGETYSYTNNVSGLGNFGGEMFISDLGILGFIDTTTGNLPISILYLTILDNKLVTLGKITFDQNMGNIIGSPYIEDKNDITNLFIKKILHSKNEYIFGPHPLNFYEGALFALADDIDKDMTASEFGQLSYKLSERPDLINFYRQKIFFKNKSLCLYNEKVIEMDAFGCKVNNKQLSVCYNYFDTGDLIYRYGTVGNIELELTKKIQDINEETHSFIFDKNQWQYEIHTEPQNSGILLKKNGKTVSFLKCNNDSIEPLIFSPIWK